MTQCTNCDHEEHIGRCQEEYMHREGSLVFPQQCYCEQDMPKTFTLDEMRISLAAFVIWYFRRAGVEVLSPEKLVDQFLEETT